MRAQSHVIAVRPIPQKHLTIPAGTHGAIVRMEGTHPIVRFYLPSQFGGKPFTFTIQCVSDEVREA